MTSLEQRYEQLSDEALLEILAEGPKNYREEAIAAAQNEARSRGMDLGQADRFELGNQRPSKGRRFLGLYFIFFGYGALVGIPLSFSHPAGIEGPLGVPYVLPLVLALLGILLLYLGSRHVISWRLCIFWAAAGSSVALVSAAMLAPDTGSSKPGVVPLAICLAVNLYFIVRFRRHAWKAPESSG